MVKRLVIVGNWYGAHDPFLDMFKDNVLIGSATMVEPNENDVVLFGGGADIYPGLYKEKVGIYTGTRDINLRDTQEVSVYETWKKCGAKFLGICRGAQLLCALAGGKVIQHVSNHAGGSHTMTTASGEVMRVSSAHHQMMYPKGTNHQLIAYSTEKLSNCYLNGDNKKIDVDVEPEVVWFPDVKALAIQYHPEFMSRKERGVEYARDLVKHYLLEEAV